MTETFAFLDEFASAGDHPSTVPVPAFNGVRLDHVSFRYPSGDSDAISDIDLEVKPGEVVALVGPNGSGKTTVSKLLAQLFRPTSGHMWWGSADTADLPAAGMREQIAVIFQDFERYELTLGENVSLGRIEAAGDDERLRAALADADAEDVGAEHGATLDTLLGPRWIGGTDLSIGQWQRLAIARVFYRDAPLLILDEPTASIDAQAEADTFASLRRLAVGRAVVVVSHRFSTVASADRIYVLDGGRIVEHGTHNALVGCGWDLRPPVQPAGLVLHRPPRHRYLAISARRATRRVLGAEVEAWLPKSLPYALLGIESGSSISEVAPKEVRPAPFRLCRRAPRASPRLLRQEMVSGRGRIRSPGLRRSGCATSAGPARDRGVSPGA